MWHASFSMETSLTNVGVFMVVTAINIKLTVILPVLVSKHAISSQPPHNQAAIKSTASMGTLSGVLSLKWLPLSDSHVETEFGQQRATTCVQNALCISIMSWPKDVECVPLRTGTECSGLGVHLWASRSQTEIVPRTRLVQICIYILLALFMPKYRAGCGVDVCAFISLGSIWFWVLGGWSGPIHGASHMLYVHIWCFASPSGFCPVITRPSRVSRRSGKFHSLLDNLCNTVPYVDEDASGSRWNATMTRVLLLNLYRDKNM